MRQPDDLELARRAASGDRAAFNVVVDRHVSALFRMARGLSMSREDAEDVVQETLIAAYRGIGQFNGRATLLTWMSRILIRRARVVWRKNRRHMALSLEEGLDSALVGAGFTAGAPSATIDQRLDIAAVLRTLSEKHREVIVLREVQGMSYREIAMALNIRRGTVESRIHRARAELGRCLRAYRTRAASRSLGDPPRYDA